MLNVPAVLHAALSLGSCAGYPEVGPWQAWSVRSVAIRLHTFTASPAAPWLSKPALTDSWRVCARQPTERTPTSSMPFSMFLALSRSTSCTYGKIAVCISCSLVIFMNGQLSLSSSWGREINSKLNSGVCVRGVRKDAIYRSSDRRYFYLYLYPYIYNRPLCQDQGQDKTAKAG